MKRIGIFGLLLVLLAASTALGQDVREAARKAAADRATALERAREVQERIMNDRAAFTAEVERLETEQRALEQELDRLETQITNDETSREDLTEKWSTFELEFKEISGNLRVTARDLEQLLKESPVTGLDASRLQGLAPVLRDGYFPDIDDISLMTSLFQDEIERSGQVGYQDGGYIGRDGEEREGRILTLGKFTAIYTEGDEIGFLRYNPESLRFAAMSTEPPRSLKRKLKAYAHGETDDVPIDISGGAALRQITGGTSLLEQIEAGGPLVWPIAVLAVFALLIMLAKIWDLNRIHRATGKYMTRFNKMAYEGDWAACEELVQKHKGSHSPVNHVLEAGVKSRGESRETLESILQEAILREMPRLERGLSMLAVLGAVAPLMGLLGTVTGMIDTFRVITVFGTGDPKLMSGGISEALVTTELGLAVAIPIMLMHTFLSRRVDHVIGSMEEKAVSLVNIIQTKRTAA